MFNKPQFRDFLNCRKNFDSDKFKVIAGNRTSFTVRDINPAQQEMSKEYPSPLPELNKGVRHAPKIVNGVIKYESLRDYLAQCASDRHYSFNEERLKKLLQRVDWKALTATKEPWTFRPLILYRIEDILNSI